MKMLTCKGCCQPILDRYLLNISDQSYHPNCVTCFECKTQLTDKCFSRDGKLFCREDFFRWVSIIVYTVSSFWSSHRFSSKNITENSVQSVAVVPRDSCHQTWFVVRRVNPSTSTVSPAWSVARNWQLETSCTSWMITFSCAKKTLLMHATFTTHIWPVSSNFRITSFCCHRFFTTYWEERRENSRCVGRSTHTQTCIIYNNKHMHWEEEVEDSLCAATGFRCLCLRMYCVLLLLFTDPFTRSLPHTDRPNSSLVLHIHPLLFLVPKKRKRVRGSERRRDSHSLPAATRNPCCYRFVYPSTHSLLLSSTNSREDRERVATYTHCVCLYSESLSCSEGGRRRRRMKRRQRERETTVCVSLSTQD